MSKFMLLASNLLASVTGGLLLSSTISTLDQVPFLQSFGKLLALVIGSALGFYLNMRATKLSFRSQAKLPMLAIAADIIILSTVQIIGPNKELAWMIFAMLCVRWASWSSSRSIRAGAAPRLGVAVHYAEATAFGGLVFGSLIPLIPNWNATVETILLVDIALFTIAVILDHIVARKLPEALANASVINSEFPIALVITMLVTLTVSTQMVLFVLHGALNSFRVPESDLLRSLLIPAIYGGAMIAGIFGGLTKAFLDANNATIFLFKERHISLHWVFLAAVVPTICALWLSPHWIASGMGFIALCANTILFTASLTSIRSQCGGPRLVRAMGAYFPMAIGVYVALSLFATFSLNNIYDVQLSLSIVSAIGLVASLIITRKF